MTQNFNLIIYNKLKSSTILLNNKSNYFNTNHYSINYIHLKRKYTASHFEINEEAKLIYTQNNSTLKINNSNNLNNNIISNSNNKMNHENLEFNASHHNIHLDSNLFHKFSERLKQLHTFYPSIDEKHTLQKEFNLSNSQISILLQKQRENARNELGVTIEEKNHTLSDIKVTEMLKNSKFSYNQLQSQLKLSRRKLYELVRRAKRRELHATLNKSIYQIVESIVCKYDTNTEEMYTEIELKTNINRKTFSKLIQNIRHRLNFKPFNNQDKEKIEKLYKEKAHLPLSEILDQIQDTVPQSREQIRKYITRQIMKYSSNDIDIKKFKIIKKKLSYYFELNKDLTLEEFQIHFNTLFLNNNEIKINELDSNKKTQIVNKLYYMLKQKYERSNILASTRDYINESILRSNYQHLNRYEKSTLIQDLMKQTNLSNQTIHYLIRTFISKQIREKIKEFVELNPEIPQNIKEVRLQKELNIPMTQCKQLVEYYQQKLNSTQQNSNTNSTNIQLESTVKNALEAFSNQSPSKMYNFLQLQTGKSKIELYSIVRKIRRKNL